MHEGLFPTNSSDYLSMNEKEKYANEARVRNTKKSNLYYA